MVPIQVGLWFACAMPAARAVDPVPDSQQAPLAAKILDTYRDGHATVSSNKLHVVYFTPADRDPEPRYRERLDAILEDIRAFYREGMEAAGFGPKTFDLARNADGKLMVHLVKGKEPESAYTRSGFGQDQEGDATTRRKILADCELALKADGLVLNQETVLIFCNLASWDEKARTFRHHSPYVGMSGPAGGQCFAVDSVILDLDDLTRKKPVLHDAEWGNESPGRFNTVFIGGVAHELGHAFGLPHCGERRDEQRRGRSIMGSGNHNYREERRDEGPGAFLTMASAMRLASNPLFRKSEADRMLEPRFEESQLELSTNVSRSDLAGRRGALRVEGTVKATPPVYAVIAYFDSLRDGGYRAPTATSVPDAEGRFAIEISDLAATKNGQIRIEYCLANGVVAGSQVPFRVSHDGKVDLEQWQIEETLDPLAKATNADSARLELRRIEAGHCPELTKAIARKLAATFENEPKPSPADVPATVVELPLGDARPQIAEVAWLKPSANRVPANDEIPSPLLDSGEIYATGLYAHAPSCYVFDLGGKWKSLRGEAGLHTAFQGVGSVRFIIKADGKEVFRSAVIHDSSRARYDVRLGGVKTLELVVDQAGDNNHGDWGLWLDPMLVRGP